MEKEHEAYTLSSEISAEELPFRLPPPAYEEIMGVYQTSVKYEQSSCSTQHISGQHSPNIYPKTGQHSPNIYPKTGQHSPNISPKTGQHSPNISPKTGQHCPNISPKTGRHSPNISPKTGHHSPNKSPKTGLHSPNKSPKSEQHSPVIRQNSGQHSQELPPLSYIDIMPRCLDEGNIAAKVTPKFDDFSTILEAANRWLLDNPKLTVCKCETVDKRLNLAKDGSLLYELNEMLRNEATNGYTVHVKGLRVWMIKNTHPSLHVQQIGIRNIVPERASIEIPTHGHYRSGRVIISHEIRMMGNPFLTYEGLEDTIDRIKNHIIDDPIPGTILTIESDSVKVCEHLKQHLNPNSTTWTEDRDLKWRRDTQVVRVYYIKGNPAMEEIGYEDVVPEVTEAPEMTKPGVFEVFDCMITRLGEWVSKHQAVRIVNIQQYDAKVHHSHVGTSLHVSSDSTDHLIDTHSERRMARTLRVFYITSPLSMNVVDGISCRLFLPVRTGHKTFETMNQTMSRIEAWLRITGLPIVSVETVYILFHEHNVASTDYTLSEYTVHAESDKHWLTALRVYLGTAIYTEPDPADLPPVPDYHHGLHGHGPCSIL